METYLRFVDRWAKAILIVLGAVTLFFGFQLRHLANDSNPYLLSESHPARKTILDMQKDFSGTYDAALIALHNPGGVFNRETLDAVYELTHQARRIILTEPSDAEALQRIGQHLGTQSVACERLVAGILKGGLEQNDYFAAEELERQASGLTLSAADRDFLSYLPSRLNPIKELASMAASDNILVQDGTLQVTKSLRDKQIPPGQIRTEVMGNDMMMNAVVSKDEKVALVVVELCLKQNDADGQVRAYDRFRSMVDEYRKGHPEFRDEVHIAGVPIFVAEQKRLIDRDLNTLFPFVVGVVTVVLLAYFRRPLGVLLPLLNVVMCTVWTLGLMALLRFPLDLITSTLPVFLITICGVDAIHMMNEYYTQKGLGISNKEAVVRTLREMFSPVVLTTVTTIAGFLFSTSTKISSIKVFGMFMVVGLLSAQIIALLLIPAWLNVMGSKRIVKAAEGKEHGVWIGRGLERGLAWLLPRRKGALAVFAGILVVFGALTTRIVVEDAGSSYFRKSNVFRQADEFVNAHIAGTSPGWIRIQGKEPRAMLTVEATSFINRLDQFLLAQPNVSYTYSLATYVKRMHYVLNDTKMGTNRLPARQENIRSVDPTTKRETVEQVEGDQIISQLVMMYENGGGNDLNNVLMRDGSQAATLFTMNTSRASDYEKLLVDLQAWLQTNRPTHLEVTLAGTPVIWTAVLKEIVRGQVTSFILAFLSVCAVLILWLRSWREGLLAALPLAATMIFYYGMMTLLGIELNIGTALISFMVVGIVDYSVHFLHRTTSRLSEGGTLEGALLHAIRHSGMSIAFNVAVFSLGFLTLLLSEFKPIVWLGGLVALALFISGIMSLFLISMLAPNFLKPR